MTDRVSPSRLSTYLTCPRQFEYEYIHILDGEEHRDLERYFSRGQVLDTALQRTAEEVDTETSDQQVQERAREHFADCWSEKTDVDTYPSPAAYEYDRQISAAAIDDYLDPSTPGEGIEHLRRSIGTEVHIEWTDDELGAMQGYADNIVKTRDGLLIIDYKASYSGRRFPNKSGSDLKKQVAGTGHYPSRLKKWLQIEMYCTGITEHSLYSSGDEIRFMFYGLIGSKSRTPTEDGYTVDVEGKDWEMTKLYRENSGKFRSLLKDSIEGIQAEKFDPTGEGWELIQEQACEDCDLQAACGDYIAEEVRFS